MMGWYGNGIGTSGWLGMDGFWLISAGLVGGLIMRLQPGRRGGTARSSAKSGLDVLDRRLANGEIDTQAWQAQRGALLASKDDRK